MKNLLKAAMFGALISSIAGIALADTKEIQVTAKIPALLTISDIPSVEIDLKDKDVVKEVPFQVTNNTGSIKVTIDGRNLGEDNSAFYVKNGEDMIEFKVDIKTNGTPYRGMKNHKERSFLNTGENQSLQFSFKHSDWKDKPHGSYSEVLTLTMTQE